MIDQTQLDAASMYCLQHGMKLLQGFRLADTDEGHIAKLLEYMDPPEHSWWLDIGSGFGEAARLMLEQRPDLEFTLLNNSRFQISQTPTELATVYGDMERLPFTEADFEGAMFLYSICHAEDLLAALDSASFVVCPGGTLFVFDYLRMAGDNALTEQVMFSRFYSLNEWQGALYHTGWNTWQWTIPKGSDAMFRSIAGDGVLYQQMFKDLAPVLIRAVRRG